MKWPSEPPPTAGLPLLWQDFWPSDASLEDDLAAYLQQSSIEITSSGTAAIFLALATLKQTSQRRNVVIPAYTCPLVPLAILRCGLIPVLCDTQLNHFDFCLPTLKSVCNEDTLAIIPTHLAGRLADIGSISKIAHEVGAYVVEDAAQALGAKWQGKIAGTLSDMGCFSLGVGKGLTIYGGGAVVARNEKHQLLLREVCDNANSRQIIEETKRTFALVGYYLFYRPIGLTLTFGLTLRRKLKKNQLIEAAGDDCHADFPLHRVGRWRKKKGARALKRLPSFIEQTNAQAYHRKSILTAIHGLIVMDDTKGNVGVWPYFLVLMPTEQARDLALAKLWPARLGVGRLFIHALCNYDYLPFKNQITPNARDFAARTLTITNSLWLGDADFMNICKVLEQSLG
ncbi:MAG: DegT/DnrJ/EryC1/StrS family aminotransferase [Methylophilaceae bacterium]